ARTPPAPPATTSARNRATAAAGTSAAPGSDHEPVPRQRSGRFVARSFAAAAPAQQRGRLRRQLEAEAPRQLGIEGARWLGAEDLLALSAALVRVVPDPPHAELLDQNPERGEQRGLCPPAPVMREHAQPVALEAVEARDAVLEAALDIAVAHVSVA